MANTTKATPETISLYPSDKEVIKQVMKRNRTGNVSEAVRFIIRDWYELTSKTTSPAQTASHKPHPVPDNA